MGRLVDAIWSCSLMLSNGTHPTYAMWSDAAMYSRQWLTGAANMTLSRNVTTRGSALNCGVLHEADATVETPGTLARAWHKYLTLLGR